MLSALCRYDIYSKDALVFSCRWGVDSERTYRGSPRFNWTSWPSSCRSLVRGCQWRGWFNGPPPIFEEIRKAAWVSFDINWRTCQVLPSPPPLPSALFVSNFWVWAGFCFNLFVKASSTSLTGLGICESHYSRGNFIQFLSRWLDVMPFPEVNRVVFLKLHWGCSSKCACICWSIADEWLVCIDLRRQPWNRVWWTAQHVQGSQLNMGNSRCTAMYPMMG